jgi:hypothetical protein
MDGQGGADDTSENDRENMVGLIGVDVVRWRDNEYGCYLSRDCSRGHCFRYRSWRGAVSTGRERKREGST